MKANNNTSDEQSLFDEIVQLIEKNLHRMLQFAEQFADFEIVVPVVRQLS